MHYVATVNSGNPQPKDSDGDGIPDYVEDANGNGQWEEGTETKIGDADTEDGINDSVNTLYDDVDLSGSGLSGRVKKALGLSPFDTSNPLVPTPAGAGAYPNTYTFAVAQLNYSQLNSVGSLELRADGWPLTFWRNDRQADGSCMLTWDGMHEGFGQRVFQLGIRLNGHTELGGSGSVAIADANLTALVYPYPLAPGTLDWVTTSLPDRIASVAIPEAWQANSTSWQLFCSAVSNPYFRTLWQPGYPITHSYIAARSGRTLSSLSIVENQADFALFRTVWAVDKDYAFAGLCRINSAFPGRDDIYPYRHHFADDMGAQPYVLQTDQPHHRSSRKEQRRALV